jgi:5-methylcytosine-specific restriction protein B
VRKDPTRNVTDLFFRGEFRAWFTAQLRPGDHFLLEPVEQGDDLPHALRFIVPQIEITAALLDNLLVTAVRPDWTDNRGLLGYHNPLTGQYARTPFLDLLLRARAEAAAATRENRPPKPFFAILDEMNLARVEHYFADFLSALESGQPLQLHGDASLEADEDGEEGAVPQHLAIPANLFITGTVNVDETTYMFSPKVLDRAFTLEFNHVDLRGLGAPVDDGGAALALDGFPGALTYRGNPDTGDWDSLGALGDGRWRAPVLAVHDLLMPENRHFGYRVANEIARFVVLAAEQAGDAPATLDAALDLALLQKVLPKFHGTQQELEPLLTALADLAVHGEVRSEASMPEALLGAWVMGRDGKLVAVGASADSAALPAYPRTAAKLWGMLRRLRQQGFASFIE